MSMSTVILIAVDTLSNTAESEKRNKLIDDPDRDVMYHCLREFFFIRRIFCIRKCFNKPLLWSHAIVHVNGKPIL